MGEGIATMVPPAAEPATSTPPLSAPGRTPFPQEGRRGRPPKKQKGKATGARRLNGEALDVAGAAQLLGATSNTVRARAKRGLLPCRRWGGRLIFLREEVLAFLAALPGTTLKEALENVAARQGEAG